MSDASPGGSPQADPVVTITALDERGAGLAELDGRRLEIDGALPGERVRIKRPRRKRRRVPAAHVEVLEASPERVAARCAHFGVCGGCAMQHLSHGAQLERKEAALRAALAAEGVTPECWRPAIAAAPWGYRRKARLAVKEVRAKGGVLVGFRERNAPYVAVLERCEVLVETFGHRIDTLRELVGLLDARATIPQIEVAAGDSGGALVVRHLEALSPGDVARLGDFAAATGLDVQLQSAGPDSVAPLDGTEPAELTYALPEFDLELAFGPLDFVQVNGEVNRTLVGAAIQALALTGAERVLDLFCGIGNFTLAAARRSDTVHGIEGSAALVERARRNAARNGIDTASFEVCDLYAGELGDTLGGSWDRLLLDPPRSGAGPAIAALGTDPAPRAVYVSCNPATLAVDLAALVRAYGYRVLEAGIVDMFPHTTHVESIAVLERD